MTDHRRQFRRLLPRDPSVGIMEIMVSEMGTILSLPANRPSTMDLVQLRGTPGTKVAWVARYWIARLPNYMVDTRRNVIGTGLSHKLGTLTGVPTTSTVVTAARHLFPNAVCCRGYAFGHIETRDALSP